MKKTSLLLFLLVGFSFSLKAQITDVYAGNDTVELRVGNYQYGYVQWQTAQDTVNWTDIEGANETTYRFLPTKNAYYRARAIFPNCPEEFSAICYVQVPPKADAGPDRKISEGRGATMFAMLEDDCVGEWTIIEGENGSLSDMNSPTAYFEGTDSEYKLKWTVTNACGSSCDTVSIKYFHTIMNDNYLVVDTTDIVLSDSTQLLNGTYIVAFSESVDVNDSLLLVGIGEKSFLRKVVSYSYDSIGEYYVFETVQGTLSDFLIEGVFSFDFASAFQQGRKVIVSSRYPTRHDIAELGWDGIYYRQPKESEGGVRINFDKGRPKLSWIPGPFTLPYDFAVVPTLNINEPNFLCEFERSGLHVESLKFGLYNTPYVASLQFYIPGKSSFTLKKKFPILDMPIALGMIIMGPVVAIPELTSDLTLSLQYSLGPDMSYYIVQNGFVCNYIMYDDVNGWVVDNNRHSTYDFDADWPEYGDLSGKVSLGLKVSFMLWDCVGPYAGFSLSFEGTHNTFGSGFTAEQFKIKEQFELGVKLSLFNFDLLDFNWPFVEFEMMNYKNPYSIQLLSGNNQYYHPNQQLSGPLSVLVKNSRGKPSKGVRVKFESPDGIVNHTYTNNNGVASSYWTPGSNATGRIRAEASTYDVNSEPVGGSPVVFYAYEYAGNGGGGGGGGGWGGDDCSTLSVNAFVNSSGVLSVRASGGHPPYMFSSDGVSYGTPPVVLPVQGQTYHFYVKDAAQCVADCYYTHPIQDCSTSSLNLTLSHQGNTVTAHATGGQIPYQYALDEEPYGNASVFYNLMNGYHVVNVRDANGCVDVASITLDAYGGGTGGGSNSGTVTVSTSPTVNVIDATSAHGSGSVSVTGNATVSTVGLCWSRHHAPTTSDEYVQHSYSGNSFGNLMVNLAPNVIYYLRAFAVTNTGTVYGNEVGFSTTAVAPVVTSLGVGNITPNTARALGNVSNTNGTFVTERGFCWSTSHNPTLNNNHLACGFGTGAYSGDLTGLTPDTRYYLRAYATNSVGTSYSDEVSFRTFESGGGGNTETYVVTADALHVTSNSAICGGRVVADENVELSSKGVCWSLSPNPTVHGNHVEATGSSVDYQCTIHGLAPNSRYYCRAFAIVGNETVYGGEISFKTLINGSASAISINPTEWHVVLPEDDVVNGCFSISNNGNMPIDWWGWMEFEQGANSSTLQELHYHSNYFSHSCGSSEACTEEIAISLSVSNYGQSMGKRIASIKYYVAEPSSDHQYTFRIYGEGQDGKPTEVLSEKTIQSSAAHTWINCNLDDEVYLTGRTIWASVELNHETDQFILTSDDIWGDEGTDWHRVNGASWHRYSTIDPSMEHNWLITVVLEGESCYSYWATFPQENGTVYPNSSVDICMSLNSLFMHDGDSVGATLVINTSNESQPRIEIPITLEVGTGTNNVPQGAINGLFSVGEGLQVYFSQGNLQYQASTNTWRFAENQWDYVGTQNPAFGADPGGTVAGSDNNDISPTNAGWIDLFGWGTSGYNHGAVCYQPWSTSMNPGDYYAYGQVNNNLFDQTGQADWGYNAISNGGNQESSGWRAMTHDEWAYLLDERSTASGMRYAKAQVQEVNGVILLPDDWNESYYTLNNTNEGGANYNSNVVSESQWSVLESYGAVFLPAAGDRIGGTACRPGSHGFYWTSSHGSDEMAFELIFEDTALHNWIYEDYYYGFAVRLVQDAPNGSGSGNGGGGGHK